MEKEPKKKTPNKIVVFVKRIIHFIKTGIWTADENGNGEVHWAVKPFKIALLTVRNVGQHEITLRSAALTIFTVMSLVPIAALIFGILKGFGFEENLTEYLYNSFPQYTNVIDTLMEFVNRTLIKTKGGIIAAVGIAVLLWAVIKLFGNIEDAFNNIWEIRKPRSIFKKFSNYTALIFIAPILLVSSISLSTFIREFLSSFVSADWLIDIALFFASLILVWVLFAFLYWMMPNTKVQVKSAFIAGMIAGTAFYIFSVLYFFIQGKVSSYNAIYGTFAAIPLFLAWLQTSWQILLMGGALSYAYQNIGRFDQEQIMAHMDTDHKRKILVATMLSIVKNYLKEEGAVDTAKIADELDMSERMIRDMVFKLEEAGLVIQVQDDKEKRDNLYVPAKDAHTIKVSDVIESVDNNMPDPKFETSDMRKVDNLLNKMKKEAYSPDLDVYLIQLI